MMMASGSDSPLPLLVILALCSLLGCCWSSAVPSGTAAAATARPLRPRGFLDSTEDYDRDYDESTPPAPTATRRVAPTGAAALCDYDVCRENQTPCEQLAAASGCLCPGVSTYNAPPDPPVLKTLRSGEGGEEEEEGVTVRWCAPYSSVSGYVVTVGGEERGAFGKERRSGGLGRIEHVSRVCVLAVNEAGSSGADAAESCAMYRPPGGGASQLTAGLIGGALGFLLLLCLALLLWRLRLRRRKAEARVSTRSLDDAERTEGH